MVLATATTPPSKGQGLDKLNTKHLIMLRVWTRIPTVSRSRSLSNKCTALCAEVLRQQ
jgi:hypothetical protein